MGARTAAVSAVVGVAALGLALLLPAGTAGATERRFGYSYQSGVLLPGEVELEPWTTVRLVRESTYVRFDERLELELGLTQRLQTAFYLNLTAVTKDVMGVREREFELKGVSSEWKLKLLDPVADPLGLALYWEVSVGPSEMELETKLIIDKRIGGVLIAFNVVGEYEVEWEDPGQIAQKGVVELDVGVGYFFTPAFFAGLELRSHNDFTTSGGWEHSVLFAGPTVSFSQERWWFALTLLPQVAALKGATTGPFHLSDHERMEVRLLFGVHL